MKVSDYIVYYLIHIGVKDVFGYPGGMVTHLMDSFCKCSEEITVHLTYHEQGAAFAACGYAQAGGELGVAYATSGPGATNLITGICNAFFDSIPTLFITGQVNEYENKGNSNQRQRGFQETDIVSMVSNSTKYAAHITYAEELKRMLPYAVNVACSGRKGPVLLDIPMNILCAEIEPGYEFENRLYNHSITRFNIIVDELFIAHRPLILVGNGVKSSGATECLKKLLNKSSIPVITSMLAVDLLPEYSYGFLGTYGSRTANFILSKCDLLIVIGARLDIRQVGAKRHEFAKNARIIRIDVDEEELLYGIREDDININADAFDVIDYLCNVEIPHISRRWIKMCEYIRRQLSIQDVYYVNDLIKKISKCVPDNSIITSDVGQNQIWVAQSFEFERGHRLFTSGGHGAMGYSLPASIGCAIYSHATVVCFNGDGGIQMNIQELQVVAREQLPIKIVVLNNSSLGMIRYFQEQYFEKVYFQTVESGGYVCPNFGAISKAYGIPYTRISKIEEIDLELFKSNGPQFVEVIIDNNSYSFPKVEYGHENYDPIPLIDRGLFGELESLNENNVLLLESRINMKG